MTGRSTCSIFGLALLLFGCASQPQFITKTETVEVPVMRIVPVPAALTDDCQPAPLTGTSIEAILSRLASVETALADCRDQLSRIRALPLN